MQIVIFQVMVCVFPFVHTLLLLCAEHIACVCFKFMQLEISPYLSLRMRHFSAQVNWHLHSVASSMIYIFHLLTSAHLPISSPSSANTSPWLFHSYARIWQVKLMLDNLFRNAYPIVFSFFTSDEGVPHTSSSEVFPKLFWRSNGTMHFWTQRIPKGLVS